MGHPLLYEVNTRVWLRELSENEACPISLASVPQSEIVRWQSWGITDLWLMGVWSTGALARRMALQAASQGAFQGDLPDWKEEDIGASPYAISEYVVSPALGGASALSEFRERLNAAGLRLILDFVPNHLGLDHAIAFNRPELCVHSAQPFPGSFARETICGTRWLAHGRDPYFPPWTDTVQLDYRNPATQVYMTEILGRIAQQCDGVRCDMAMLLLDEVFRRTWANVPGSHAPPPGEFWQHAIDSVRQSFPDFLFLAEVYWGLESRLLELGFDYTYDKELYDRVVEHAAPSIVRHIQAQKPRLHRGAHFLENHDEPRIADRLGHAEHRAAAAMMLSLPGMRFVHQGQIDGWKARLPVQLLRRRSEEGDSTVRDFYQHLLRVVDESHIGEGVWDLVPLFADESDSSTFENIFAVKWQLTAHDVNCVLINLGSSQAVGLADLPRFEWVDLLSAQARNFTSANGRARISLAPFEVLLLGSRTDHPAAS